MQVATLDAKDRSTLAAGGFVPRAGGISRRLDISVSHCPSEVEGLWRKLETVAAATVYQRYDWVDSSLSTLHQGDRRHAFIVSATLNGEPVFLLPLSIRGRWLQELTWAGGSHANYNCGLFSPEFAELMAPGEIRAVMDRVRGLVPGIGLIRLCCQPTQWEGVANPLLALGGQSSVNRAFVMDLRDGFEALLARGNSKRKRKKFRQQERAAERVGGYRLIVAATPEQSQHILDIFFDQKSNRLRGQGKRDVFASEHARRFLAELAGRSGNCAEPLLRLYALEIGGKVRAVFGAGAHRRRLSGYFNSIAEDDLAAISPGEMLLYLVAQQAASEGVTHIDLGAGEERYKRSWCDSTVEMFDVILPTGPASAPIAAAARMMQSAKRIVRQDRILWNAVSAARSLRRNFPI